jgi:hypothetical protein
MSKNEINKDTVAADVSREDRDNAELVVRRVALKVRSSVKAGRFAECTKTHHC